MAEAILPAPSDAPPDSRPPWWRQVVDEWNATHADFPQCCAHALFEAQAARTPEAPAVALGEDTERTLSYGELNARANQLAHHLRRRGCGPDRLIGVCLDRTPEMVAALLAVWKAGAAYVPLDPAYPPERLAFMVRDADLSLLLSDDPARSFAAETLLLTRDWSPFAGESPANPPPAATPDHLAYVMYTSGSTGLPKGAMIEHRGLVNYLTWAVAAYGLTAGETVPVHSSIAFDLTVTSLYPPLLAGGCVELLPADLGAQNLLAALRRGRKQNLVKITPAHLEILRRQLSPAEMANASRAFVIGGEALVADSLHSWREHAPETRLINEYGPTETVVGCCVHEVRTDDPQSGPVPIGRPIANTRLYVLDESLQPLPPGETGELYIGGAGVARGYLNRPELTRERFLADPYAAAANTATAASDACHPARMYKTGDLARYRDDGILEYLGRTDSQVKLRGYRIELGEIEAQLAAHPAVQACTVLVREDQPGNRQLVAYASPRQAEAGARDLQDFLRQRLPDYMVPAYFVFLDTLPLTDNGKVDRQALLASALVADTRDGEQGNAGDGPAQPPRTAVERKLAAIFGELLKREHLGIDDDFFDLGGHSLLAMKAVSRIRDAFQVDLKIQALFARPTVAGLAQALAEAGVAEDGPQRIEPRPAGVRPLPSFAQEQLWFLEQRTPGNPAYNLVGAIPLAAPGDPAVLRRVLAELTRRHEVLRTVFTERDGQPVLSVLPAAAGQSEQQSQRIQQFEFEPFDLPELDLSALPPAEQVAAWQQALQTHGRQPLLREPRPPLRWLLVRLADGEQRLLLAIHQIVADEESLRRIEREVRELYAAFAHERASPLAELPFQYADFACWQRNRLHGELRHKLVDYWRHELAGAPTVLDLPTDRPRPPLQSFAGASERFDMRGDLPGRLKALARNEQATLTMVLAAAFAALLHRYTGQDDLLVGTPAGGRAQRETEKLVGHFANTLVLRARFADDMDFRGLLRQMRERLLGAQAHAELPFHQLAAAVAAVHDGSRPPLVQVMFALHEADAAGSVQASTPRSSPAQAAAAGAGAGETPASDSTRFDLSLTFTESRGRLSGTLEFCSELFAPETMRRFAGHLLTLIDAVARNPEQPIATLPLLTDGERRQLLIDWNDTAVAYPAGRLLHQLFEAQAARTPEAPAVISEQGQLSYRELDERSNQLARALQRRGVAPDTCVALCVERSLEMVVGIFGILKAGGAYLPIDPDYPPQRIAYMLAESGAPVLLSQAHLCARLPAGDEGKYALVCLDHDWPAIAAEAAAPVTSAATADNLAYVIYTSGSTGRPKGIMISHAAICNHMAWLQRTHPLHPEDALLQKTPFGFDASAWEFFAPLAAGSRLVMARPGGHADPAYLAETIRRHGISVLQLVPSQLTMLLDEPSFAASAGSLRSLFCGGEALTPALYQACREQLPGVRVSNLYGPTEATIDATCWDAPVETGDAASTPPAVVPIGRPIDNLRAYVVDARLQPVPIGVPGELLIGGSGLARGYLGQPELTARKFIADPFLADPSCPESGERVYRSGDRARFLADGSLEFRGRLDHQVKLHGHRIEPAEIEAGLAGHPAVRQQAVVVHRDAAGEQRLVAYVAADPVPDDPEAHAAFVDALRAQLRQTLPEYMLPAQFVVLDRLPLTASGKIDRQALPAATPVPAAARTLPRTPREQQVQAIFSEVLGQPAIDVDDSFFDLGGHSIMAIKAVSRLRNTFDTELTLQSLFAHPTVAAVAELIDEAGGSVGGGAGSLQITPRADTAAPCELSFAEEQVWFLEQLAAGSPAYNVVQVVEFSDDCDADALKRALDELARRHEILRTVFHSAHGRPQQTVLPELHVELPVHDLGALPAAERDAAWLDLVRTHGRQSFELSRAPLFHAVLVRLATNEYRLLLTLHHIVVDEWSMAIIDDELRQLHAAFRRGQPSPLPELPIQYADFALWQRERLRGEVLQRQIDYWREELAGAATVLDLPTDLPRPPVQSFRGAAVAFTVPAALTAELKALARREQATLFMVLEAAFAALLHRQAGQDDILVGSPITGRTQSETEGLVGYFLNILVLRSHFTANMSFRDLLQQMRSRSLGAYAHAELPFQQLVAVVKAARDASRSPLFQAMFVLHDADGAHGGHGSPQQALDNGSAKFDLTLFFAERDGRLAGALEYCTDLFAAGTIERLAGELLALLDSAVGDPDAIVTAPTLHAAATAGAGQSPPAATSAARPPVAPRTRSETWVLQVFQDVLGRRDFGVEDSFFDLGGHSLMATEIIARIQDESGINVPLRHLFERPTAAGLAEAIDGLVWLARAGVTDVSSAAEPASDREEIAF